MKVKINWSELGKQLWAALKPVLLGAVGGGVIALTDGCSSVSPQTKGQTTEIIAVGIPAVAWISHSTQQADNSGGDTNALTNAVEQSVPVTTYFGK